MIRAVKAIGVALIFLGLIGMVVTPALQALVPEVHDDVCEAGEKMSYCYDTPDWVWDVYPVALSVGLLGLIILAVGWLLEER